MDQIKIIGGNPLRGKIYISGAKNAALKLVAASLLSDKPLTLQNVPHVADVTTMISLLMQFGVDVQLMETSATTGRTMRFNAGKLIHTTAPYDLVRTMRASIVTLGPLVARMGEAKVSLPGGCAIGTRPVDLHIQALESLGAEIELKEGYIYAKAPHGLQGGHFTFPMVSVTATENLMMAACLASGETEIKNAAREPEISDLGECLKKMGAEIEGLGTSTIRIQGRASMNEATHTVIADRIEAGTYAAAAAITNGEVELINFRIDTMDVFVDCLRRAGVSISPTDRGVLVKRADTELHGVDIMTEPYPGFPTDLQAQMMALLTLANGASMITETIFENRFMHVPELSRMGADITVHNHSALVHGVKTLQGAPVMATDLRASVSLILAGLAAQGETTLSRVYHLDRGYERLDEKLSACGAQISRTHE